MSRCVSQKYPVMLPQTLLINILMSRYKYPVLILHTRLENVSPSCWIFLVSLPLTPLERWSQRLFSNFSFRYLSRSWKISWHLIKEYRALFSQIRLENILTSPQEYPVLLLQTQISTCWDFISSLSPKVCFEILRLLVKPSPDMSSAHMHAMSMSHCRNVNIVLENMKTMWTNRRFAEM